MYKKKSVPMLSGRWLHLLLMVCHSFIVASCATLPAGLPVSDEEQAAVRQKFQVLVATQQGCMKPIDADIAVSFENLFQQGSIHGYLQAMPPAYLRFDGLNPLGLTEVIFSTDGCQFTLVKVRERLGYRGSVTAKKIQHYAPAEFSADLVFLLNGLLPDNEKFRVWRVRGEEQSRGFWLDLEYPDSQKAIKILYHPDRQEIERVIVTPANGKDSVTVSYRYSAKSSENSCPEPQSIRLDSNGSGVMSIDFSKRYPVASFKEDHFQVVVPPNYKQVTVQ